MGFAASQTTLMLSHTLTFALLLAMFTNLTQHTFFLCWSRRAWLEPKHWARFGPAYANLLATVFIMVHPTHTVLLKHKQVNPFCCPWTLYLFTILGYLLLAIGTLWVLEVVQSLRPLSVGNGRAHEL
mmetsp:Transcript_37995/g.96333  ORF Transcript_37995/g.96333 Transcript_37995/m.96333 type:complete len:127 (-) Transcript_37995:84-464(-)|eukprot:CAMPEP_0183446680 /NCGR_PEP_ID=MMETSP0370-20130417/99372_1 /TAXON_ID=268820 /ORGANISM="Peridinium aciculiferum, Strain PAER-2" /LENGTH=126 /DNA_ID=CAMNT_0025637451 /DNA_START=223 /DNA_END=603 /DNA_ORIENTATION=+